jgi:drug/metabolite transporter (DMT)-like permease
MRFTRPRGSRQLVGVALTIAGAFGFAANVIVTVLVYRSGSEPVTYIMVRAAGFALVLGIMLLAINHPLRLPPTATVKAVLLGVLFAVQSFTFFNGISLIPVSVAAIIEYTYPIQIAIYMRVVHLERMSWVKIVALFAAFLGVMLAVFKPSDEAIDPTGVAYIVLGSMLVAAMMLISNRVMGTIDSRRLTLHMTATVAVLYFLLFVVTDLEPVWPQTESGWILLAAAPFVYLGGMLAFFTGLAMIGPTRASMLANSEPIFILMLAVPILGEVLSPWQLLGAALVIGSIFGMQLGRKR